MNVASYYVSNRYTSKAKEEEDENLSICILKKGNKAKEGEDYANLRMSFPSRLH